MNGPSPRVLISLVGLTAVLLSAGVSRLPAQESREHSFLARSGLEAYLEDDLRGFDFNLAVDYRHEHFFFLADMSLRSDGKYASSHGEKWMDLYTMFNGGGIGVHFGDREEEGRFELRAGRLTFDDVINSPYSLFVSDQEYPPLMGEINYAHSYFFYTTRGMALNYRSLEGYPMRGANLKTFGIDLKNGIRFGVQEASVYTDIPFDPEYFLSPIPQFFTQYTNKSSGKPWGMEGNDNYIVGFFGEYTAPQLELFGQVLVDDFATIADNPNKVAWHLGGRRPTELGTFGFYHAGATKYTFQAFGNTGGVDTEYEYTYYPASSFTLDGEEVPIRPEENYIGYRHGENNLAFLSDYAGEAAGVQIGAALEYVITGEQAPSNPWFEADTYKNIPGPATRLLDGVLEHEVQASVSGRKVLGDWQVTLSGMLGYVWNDSALVNTSDPMNSYFQPQPGKQRLLYSLSLGVQYTLGIE